MKLHDYLIQPSSFWTKRCWDEIGALSPDLHFIFDWDWFIRAQAQGVRYLSTYEVLSVYRIHEQHKSGTGGNKRMDEIRKIYEMYSAPEYAALFDYVRANRPAIDSLMTKLVKIRLSRFYIPILCVFFPDLFFKYRKLKLRDMIEMG